ncbi:unnamed protein product, partial [Durusdinium trenchii]
LAASSARLSALRPRGPGRAVHDPGRGRSPVGREEAVKARAVSEAIRRRRTDEAEAQ